MRPVHDMHWMRLLVLLTGLVLFALCDPAEGARQAADVLALGAGGETTEDATEDNGPDGAQPSPLDAALAIATANATVNATANATDNATAEAAEPNPGARWTEPRTGMVFRWIPKGCFTMGSPKKEPGRQPDEGPQHRVCVSGFWLGETEVTQGQWTALMGKNPSLIKNGDDYPVDMISWDMAQTFVAALNGPGGAGFRLPTEAEWEYACRAGTSSAYFYGEEISRDQASFDKRFSLPAEPLVPKRKSRRKKASAKRPAKIWANMHTNVVGSFPANAFGLHDMHGNVWEWCQDVYNREYYRRSPRENPRHDGEGTSRVLRGGSWVTKAETLRSANRSRGWPNLRTAFYGLRVVRSAHTPGPAEISR
ncbi:MAG: formylglycine-generating enzyme family protein [Desulfovibrio sp.]